MPVPYQALCICFQILSLILQTISKGVLQFSVYSRKTRKTEPQRGRATSLWLPSQDSKLCVSPSLYSFHFATLILLCIKLKNVLLLLQNPKLTLPKVPQDFITIFDSCYLILLHVRLKHFHTERLNALRACTSYLCNRKLFCRWGFRATHKDSLAPLLADSASPSLLH